MIFVTVGTHEQPFDRLLKCIDKMVENGDIKDEVVIQKGYTDYEPLHCKAFKLISYEKMQEYIKKADIVITHGGPASFLMPLSYGKIPIVFPRQYKYKEHVNNHQEEFVKAVKERYNNILVAYNEDELVNTIKEYKQLIIKMNTGVLSHNKEFCKNLENIIIKMFRD